MKTIISIITPTYNRKELLLKCFESLKRQTSFEFEWIVIDDGSTDGTKESFQQLLKEDWPFRVVYHWKENGGKHTALNAAHTYVQGEYVLLLDSDDTLSNHAVEVVLTNWKLYENNKNIGMLIFLKQLTDGTLVAKGSIEKKELDVFDDKRITVITSDCCEVIRSTLFLKYPFPVYEGERFLAETALWYRVGLDANCIFINIPIYICEYLEGGLTKGGKELRIRNCQGGMYTSMLRMNKRCSMKERIKAGVLYSCYSHFAKTGMLKAVRSMSDNRMLAAICYLPGAVLYFIWKKQYLI